MFQDRKTPHKPTPAITSLVISKGGFFNGNITKMNEAAERVIAIDEKRNSGQQQPVAR